MSLYQVVDENPNEDVGGGGTLCGGEAKSEDCRGPFIVFPGTETDSNVSPYAVICSAHLEELVKRVVDHECDGQPPKPQEDAEDFPEV